MSRLYCQVTKIHTHTHTHTHKLFSVEGEKRNSDKDESASAETHSTTKPANRTSKPVFMYAISWSGPNSAECHCVPYAWLAHGIKREQCKEEYIKSYLCIITTT